MAHTRPVSLDLLARLRCARQLETLAESRQQLGYAISGTAALLQASVDAGWRISELAPVLGLSRTTASKRLNDARRAGRMNPSGLVVDSPIPTLPPLAEFALPVSRRDWLTRSEAAAYLGMAARTVHGLHDDGLLPNTRWASAGWRAYFRLDLDRVLRAPRRGHLIDRVRLRAQISQGSSAC